MLTGISKVIHQHFVMGPVAAPLMQHLNIQTGQVSCPEVAEFLGYLCAPMPLCG
ncbi:hypothetical protein ACIGCM_04715 [Pseudomonas sp. NPDC078700]|uniref:hypothetical protein n=1 Tax=Pseudomonas sp. NPDC078700 TaxID=3364424 RepID=UPI0037C7DCAE